MLARRLICGGCGKHVTTISCQFLKPLQNYAIILSASTHSFWEPDKKSGYRIKNETSVPFKTHVKEGMKLLRTEIGKFYEETKDKFYMDKLLLISDGDYEYFWKFEGQDSISPWIVTTDSDHNQGKSSATLSLSKTNKCLFQGYISEEVPKDGVVKRSGYCNMRSPNNMKSFLRQIPYDFTQYTHLLVRCRGDGRPYMLNIKMLHHFDMLWNDLYNYPLYTRGGPYWQLEKIPFSKFFLSHKGRIQDKQEPLRQGSVENVGITIGATDAGPFQLEIDFIALIADYNHEETFAYESYMNDEKGPSS